MVAAAMHYGAFVRMDSSNFNWHHWAIYREEYLDQYFREEKEEKNEILGKLKIICSDINFKAANNTVKNLR